MGLFLDNPQLLRRAADYLETHADPDTEPLELPTRVVRRKFAPPPANTDRLIDAFTLAEQISQRIALSRKQQRRAEIQADLVQLGHTKSDRQRKPKRTGSD